MARTLVPNLNQGGNVQTVLDWVGGGLHGEPGGSKQVPAGGEHHLSELGVCLLLDSCSQMTVQEPTQSWAVYCYSAVTCLSVQAQMP